MATNAAMEKMIEHKKELRERDMNDPNRRKKEGLKKTVDGVEITLPPGQVLAKSWIVLDLGLEPGPEYSLDENEWKLAFSMKDDDDKINSNKKALLLLKDIEKMGLKTYRQVQWHCVTGWSAVGLEFQGIPLKTLLSAFEGDKEDWKYMMQISSDGYAVPVFREDITDECFLATRMGDGSIIPKEHGGPRLVFPNLYGWKSAKYLNEIRLQKDFEKGTWEKLYCHDRGRIEFNERWAPEASFIWTFLIKTSAIWEKIFGVTFWTRMMSFVGNILGYLLKTFTNLFKLQP